MLKEGGYVTGCFGKWGLGYPGSEGSPENQGFDEFYGYNCQRLAHNYYPPFSKGCSRKQFGEVSGLRRVKSKAC
jgi:arylsulfatase A-like enzyme